MSETLLRLGLVLFLIPWPAIVTGFPSPISVVITTDCGVDMDDQWAIVHAALSPRITTLAVIGGFAPEPHDLGSAQTLGVRPPSADVHRPFGGYSRPPGSRSPFAGSCDRGPQRGRRAADPACRRVLARPPPDVLAFGPVTDIASAILAAPGIADRIEVVALAFDRYPQGGDGWNVRNDAGAWQALLDADVPVTAASGYLALERLNLTRSEAQAMIGGQGPPGAYLACLHAGWLDEFGTVFADETGGSDRWPVWDEAVVAVILDLTTWRELPRPALRDDLSFSFPNVRSRAPFRWVVAMDRERVFGDLADLLTHLSSKAPGQSAAIARQPRKVAAAISPQEQAGWMQRHACDTDPGR